MAFVFPVVSNRRPSQRRSDELFALFGKENVRGMDDYFIKDLCNEISGINEKMKYEGNRLASFLNWPFTVSVYPTQFAKAGFYYTGNNTEVVCFACEGRIKDWKNGDQPLQKHIRTFPTCAFVCGNVPGVNLLAPRVDEEEFPDLARLDRKVDELAKQIEETNIFLSTRRSSENTNMTASTTPGQVLTRTWAQSAGGASQNMRLSQGVVGLRDKNERMKTFVGNWSDAWPITPRALADAGFYYCGPEDLVQCPWCFGKLQGWERNDDPLVEHARHFPSCPKFGNRKAVTASSLNIHNSQGDSNSGEFTEDELGILTVRPCNPQYAIEATRLQSFRNKWRGNPCQTPENLSSAGFFFIGYGDHVKCFFCDGGLCNWEPDDEPWTEHARWFPDCGFLKQVKGSQFIQQVKDLGFNGGPVTSENDQEPMKKSPASLALSSDTSEPPAESSSQHGSSATTKLSSISQSNDLKREIRHAMNSPTVAKALETGIPKDAIETALKENILAGNGHFTDVESLINNALLINDRLSSTISPAQPKSCVAIHEEKHCETKKQKKRKNKESSSSPPRQRKDEDEFPLLVETPMSLGETSNPADAKSLEEENLKLKEQRLCKICMDEEVSIVLLPCGHLVSCVKCAPALRNCPICRNAIKGTVRTFMA